MTQPSVSLLRHAASLDTANLCSISSPRCRLSFVYPWTAVHQQTAAERPNQAEPKLWDTTFWARAEFRTLPPLRSPRSGSHHFGCPIRSSATLSWELGSSLPAATACGLAGRLIRRVRILVLDLHTTTGLTRCTCILAQSLGGPLSSVATLEQSSRRTEPLDILFEPYPQTTPPYARDESRSGSLSGRGSGNRSGPCFMFVWDRQLGL